jgi:DMSO/TMAO reductase YedYZ heme-binding membrane subunit
MRFGARTRKWALTLHVASSVGWLGAVLAVLALAIGALAGSEETRRSAYVAAELVGWAVLVPLALASFATGVIQSLGTRWGLLRHYWVVFKLVITIVATVVLLLYTRTLDDFATAATHRPMTPADEALLETPSVVLHAAVATVLLAITTVLAVFKPVGLTVRGRKHAASR